MLRSSKKRLLSYKRYYRRAKRISFENSDILTKFQEVYPSIDEKKFFLTPFGDEMFPVIDEVQDNANKDVFFSRIGIEKNKTIIAIGYNRNPAHRHLVVIKELLKLPTDLQRKLVLLLPFTYGPIDNQYLEAVDSELEHFAGKAIKLDKYLKKEELAEIICSVDIFIHAQLTDVQSMTLMEYLYTGTVVLNGSWLRYRVLSDNNILYYTYDDFKELPKMVSDILDNEHAYKRAVAINHEKLKTLFDWETLKSQWLQLYQGKFVQ